MEKKHIDNDRFPNAPRRTLAGRYFAGMTTSPLWLSSPSVFVGDLFLRIKQRRIPDYDFRE